MSRLAPILCAWIAACVAATPAFAAATFTFSQVGDDVVGLLEGDLDIGGLPFDIPPADHVTCLCRFSGASANIFARPDSPAVPEVKRFAVAGPRFFFTPGTGFVTTGAQFMADQVDYSGTLLRIWGNPQSLYLPLDYGPDAGGAFPQLTGEMRIRGASIRSLDVQPGDYVYSLGFNGVMQDTLTVRFLNPVTPPAITLPPIPLPAPLAGLVGALALLGWMARRRA